MNVRENTRFGNRRRTVVIAGAIGMLLGVLAYRLVQLQFVQYEQFRSQAEKNSIRRLSREPLRGLIYGRDGKLLVANNPTYTMTITPFEFRDEAMPLLARLFGVDTDLVRQRMSAVGRHSFEPVKVLRELPFGMLSTLEENRASLPGVSYVVESRREYHLDAHLAHLLGYTKEISPPMLKRLGAYYQPGDMVGYNGIESYYEDVLRGRKGYGFYTVNSQGRVMERFESGRSDIAAIEGDDLVLTIDMDLQRYAESLLRHQRGAIVALDPRNGEVLAFASAPDYDLRDMTGRISLDVWKRLTEDERHPMYNRCSMAAYPPGSTFKMMLAAAALQEGIIDESTTINCPGSFTLAGVTFKCHGAHGNVNVVHAIEYSCNVFFYKLIFKLGFDNYSAYGRMFHFGRKTGMDISNERPGVLPSEAYYNHRYGKRWNKGYLVSLGIGQGEVDATPLQMAAYTATIANGGTYFHPHAVHAIVNHIDGLHHEVSPSGERLPISSHVWRIVQQGMYRVVNGAGTGYAARVAGIPVAGKTGTAQNPHGRDHAWFVGYAPFGNPKIAVAVIIENGGYGGDAAAPIAGDLIRQYLSGGVPRVRKDTTATHPVETAPKTRTTVNLAD